MVRRPESADIIVHPALIHPARDRQEIAEQLAATHSIARAHDKILLVFVVSDREVPVVLEGCRVLVYRIGLTRRYRLPNEFPVPFLWHPAPRELPPNEQDGKPVLGFCGAFRGRPLRRRTLKLLSADHRFDCRFVLRHQFWGSELPREVARQEYFDNIAQSHFVICDRGKGNWSVRLYEVLASGRIPAFVDTGMDLPPARGLHPWSDAVVSAPTARKLAERIWDVWASGDVVERQRRCLELYRSSLSREGFARTIEEQLEKILQGDDYADRLFRPQWRSTCTGLIRRTRAKL
ncbi:MAG: hypothetical protein JWQ36_3113 [Enterovirga sp.]|jgi:hypothetical protein|nr:hypothetical protein [Enterovirga sp.]